MKRMRVDMSVVGWLSVLILFGLWVGFLIIMIQRLNGPYRHPKNWP